MRWIVSSLLLASLSLAVGEPVRAEDLRLNLDQPAVMKDGAMLADAEPDVGIQSKAGATELTVVPRIDPDGFVIRVAARGYLQKLEPTTIALETQQKGRWLDAELDVGRYLKKQFDPQNPQQIRIESLLKFDLAAGDRRYGQEKDQIDREARRRAAGGKDGAIAKARLQVVHERIAAIREENIEAGADKRGKGTAHSPPLPRQAFNFDKADALERILKEQCAWRSVAEVFQATGFAVPDERDADFTAAYVMAAEIQQALTGIKLQFKYLSDGQYNTLAEGNLYELRTRFMPQLGASADWAWKTAPAVRFTDGVVRRAQLEGSLDRQREQMTGWWRIECQTPIRIKPELNKGDGDAFWTWVESPDPHVRYIRLLLHSPGTRYRMTLSMSGAAKGEELTLYDGPATAPDRAPY